MEEHLENTAPVIDQPAEAADVPMILFFDTETTGLPNWKEPSDDPNQPFETWRDIVNPGVSIPDEMAALHGITTEIAIEKGITPADMLTSFLRLASKATLIVGHNISFDIRMMRIQAARLTGEKWEPAVPTFCTMKQSTNHCRILAPTPRHAEHWKWPQLGEAVRHFFGEDLPQAHSALADCAAARRVYFHLKTLEA